MSGSAVIEVVRGDITVQEVDAIVNAANSTLLGGGGVDGAIHAAAGPSLLEECRAVRVAEYPRGLPPGEAIATHGGDLSASYVIHTVGPKYWEYPDGGSQILADCHRNSIREAIRVGARSVAVPAISCGVYGWRPIEAAPIAVSAVAQALGEDESIELVRFVLFNDDALAAYSAAVAKAAGA